MTTTIDTPDKLAMLMRFVAPETDIRTHLTKPMRQDGFLYASDGWIAVRVLDDQAIEAGEHPAKSNISKIFDKPIQPEALHPLPELPAAIKCKHCGGSGIQYFSICDECDGEGSFTHGTHNYECKECDGDGSIYNKSGHGVKQTCWHCSGHGEADHHGGAVPIKIGGLHFKPHLLRMIASLPGARIEHITPADETELPATRFTFDGGEGAVMPIKV